MTLENEFFARLVSVLQQAGFTPDQIKGACSGVRKQMIQRRHEWIDAWFKDAGDLYLSSATSEMFYDHEPLVELADQEFLTGVSVPKPLY